MAMPLRRIRQAALALGGFLVLLLGFAWLARLDAQTKEYVANPALLHEKLMRGEFICQRCGIRKDSNQSMAHEF